MRRSRVPLYTLLLLLPCLTARAENWMPIGPQGGDVRSLAADPRDPRVVYLGTADGVLYRSEDTGASWRRLRPGFPERGMSLRLGGGDRRVLALAVTGRIGVGVRWAAIGRIGGHVVPFHRWVMGLRSRV